METSIGFFAIPLIIVIFTILLKIFRAIFPPVESGVQLPNERPGQAPGPSEQGDAMTCTAHALGKAICRAGENKTLNFKQAEAITGCINVFNARIKDGGDNIIEEGSWPEEWNNTSVYLKNHGVSAGTDNDKSYRVNLKVKECPIAKFDHKKIYVLVLDGTHTVYINKKVGDVWYCYDSYQKRGGKGKKNRGKEKQEIEVPVNDSSDKIYEVEVEFVPETGSGSSSGNKASNPSGNNNAKQEATLEGDEDNKKKGSAHGGNVQQQEPTEATGASNRGREETTSKKTTSRGTKYDTPIAKLTEDKKETLLDIVSLGIVNAERGKDLTLARNLDCEKLYEGRLESDDIRKIPMEHTIRYMLDRGWLMKKGNDATIQSILDVLKSMGLASIIAEINEKI